jgi:hypothetical protein
MELAANDNIRYREACNPARPVELLFGQIEDAMDYAGAGGGPYSIAQVVTNAYVLLFKTSMLPVSDHQILAELMLTNKITLIMVTQL